MIIFTQYEGLRLVENEYHFTLRIRLKCLNDIYVATMDCISTTISCDDMLEISNVRITEFNTRIELKPDTVMYDVIMLKLNAGLPIDECLTVAA